MSETIRVTEVDIRYKPDYKVDLFYKVQGSGRLYELHIAHMTVDATNPAYPNLALDIKQQQLIWGHLPDPEHYAMLREWLIDCFEMSELHQMSEFLKIDGTYAVEPRHDKPLYKRIIPSQLLQ